MNLESLGWTADLAAAWAARRTGDEVPARVMREGGGLFHIQAADGLWIADIAGRLRHAAKIRADLPSVGDWVLVESRPNESRATIVAVLPRRTCFARKKAGDETEAQVIAANIDRLLVVCALDGGRSFNARGLQRYFTLAMESGAATGLVLNKVDLVDDLETVRAAAAEVAREMPLFFVSALTGQGMDELAESLGPGQTCAMIGMSGVGKSHLVNRLLGEERQEVGEVRAKDRRGRHTTTARELLRLPSGGLIMDTPGMRELQLWADADSVDETFPDIVELAAQCKFRDCSHTSEPGCAVLAAMEEGKLDPARYDHFLTLRKEVEYLERRQSQRLQREEKKRHILLARQIHEALREKGKRLQG